MEDIGMKWLKGKEMELNKSKSQAAPIYLIVLFFMLGLSSTSFAAVLEFAQLKLAKKVTFALVPRGNWSDWADFKQWNDESVRRFGCFYSTDDPLKINTLIEIMKRGGFESSGEKPTNGPSKTFGDVREGVYFTYADGTEFRLLLNGYFWLGGPEAKLTRAQVHRSDSASDSYDFFNTNNSLPWHLMHWASYLGKPEVGAPTSSAEKCETVMRYYIQGVIPNQSNK